MRLLPLLAASALLASPVAAQESIDDLFDDPQTGIIEAEPEEQVDPDELTRDEGPSFSGSATAEAGVAFGLQDWESTDPLVDRTGFTAFFAMGSSLRLDARPTSATRLFLSLGIDAPSDGSVGFGDLAVNELFLDYTLLDSIFFRVGRQSLTWGNGQLFNPANLASTVPGSISLRAFAPLGLGGVALIAIARDGYFTDPELPGIAEVGVAARWEWNASPFSGSVAGSYQATETPRTSASVKFPIGGIDVGLDTVVEWGATFSEHRYQTLLGAFWEGGTYGTQLVAEWLFDSERIDRGLGTEVGGALLVTDLPGRWNPGLRWLHSFHDTSGEVILGVDGQVADSLRLAVGLPIAYGAPGSKYREDTEDPAGRVVSLIVRTTLRVSF